MSLETLPQTVIYQGEDKNLIIRLEDENSGDAFDLTQVQDIVVVLPATVTTTNLQGIIEKKFSAGQIQMLNAGGGKFNVRLQGSDTMQITPGSTINIEVRVTIGGFLTVVQIFGKISVQPSLFPGVL